MSKICNFKRLSCFIHHILKTNKFHRYISSYYIRPKTNHNYVSLVKCVAQMKEKLEICSALLATSIWYETKKDDVEENLAHLVTLAKIALERGDIDRAKEILQLGLQICEQHKLYTGVPYLYDILSAIALSQGNVMQAQELLVTAIEKLAIWGYNDDHYNVIDFKLRLARIYSASGQNNLAKLGFETCLKQQQRKIQEGDTSEKTGILYVNILFWYGVHMIRNDKYFKAREMINTAFDYSGKIKGLSPKQEMVILYTLADLNSELGDFDIALQSMLNAIIIGKGIGSIDLPVCYLKLGMIYEKLGYQKQAKDAYEEASKSAKVFGFFDVVGEAEEALKDINKSIEDKSRDKS